MHEWDAKGRRELKDLSCWLRDYLVDHVGESVSFGTLIGRQPPDDGDDARTIFELDRLKMFREVVDYLTEILGSEGAASEWMFHNEAFKKVAGNDPYDYLSPGEFEALALLHGLLHLSVTQRRSPPETDHCFNPAEAAFSRSATASEGSELPTGL